VILGEDGYTVNFLNDTFNCFWAVTMMRIQQMTFLPSAKVTLTLAKNITLLTLTARSGLTLTHT
jgi:hypothetical protein